MVHRGWNEWAGRVGTDNAIEGDRVDEQKTGVRVFHAVTNGGGENKGEEKVRDSA